MIITEHAYACRKEKLELKLDIITYEMYCERSTDSCPTKISAERVDD